MAIKIYKPNRAARKNMSIVDRAGLHTGKPLKQLLIPATRTYGRGSEGKITTRHRGGGVKRRLRLVDVGQTKMNVPAKVEQVEYDPNSTAYLARIAYADGERRYVLAWEGAKIGDVVITQEKAPETPGSRMQLKNITPGTFVFNVELLSGRGGKLFRSAGSYGILMDIKDDWAQVKMPSSEIRLILKDAYATIGQVSNPDWRHQRIGSAGRRRRMGWRPSVSGKAMNPVDHPHGGGEGHQPIGLPHPKTKWGKPALGVKTRRPNKYSDRYILERRANKNKKKD